MLFLSFKPRTMLSQLLLTGNIPLSNYHYQPNESVIFKLNKRSPTVKGTIVKALGPTRYVVSIEGVEREVHHNQLSRVKCLSNVDSM